MTSTSTRSIARGAGITVLLGLIAILLSNVMVAQSAAPPLSAEARSQTMENPGVSTSAVDNDVDSAATSALSVLMARSSVGKDEQYLDLRRPASPILP